MVSPSTKRFDPSSTSERHVRPSAWRQIDKTACDSFKDRILFPSWQSRSDIINYCAVVATSANPSDPTVLLRELEDAKARAATVDERLDPYSGRYFPRETQGELLASVLRNERGIEGVIRERSWNLVKERCEGTSSSSAEVALENWRRRQQEKNGR